MEKFLYTYRCSGFLGLMVILLSIWGALGISILLLSVSGSDLGVSETEFSRDAPWTPPGPFIGVVWALLYSLMAFSIWRLNDIANSGAIQFAILGLIAWCLVWPFYAFDTLNRWPGLIGNLGIFLISGALVLRLWRRDKVAALSISLVTIWITIATGTIIDGAIRYGW